MTLSRLTIAICAPASEHSLVLHIRSYLETNCPWLTIDEYASGPDASGTLDAIERALCCDIVLLLLSPDSVPSPWPIRDWEPVLVHEARRSETIIAFGLAQPCSFPALFKRQPFFQLTIDSRLAGLRDLRCWLMERNPEAIAVAELPPHLDRRCPVPPGLEAEILDAPGCSFDVPREIALAFAHEHAAAFQGVLWIPVSGRSLAGIVGDTAHLLGLKLQGTTEQNAAALRDFASRRRFLYVFENPAEELRDKLIFGGSASVLFAGPGLVVDAGPPASELLPLFANWYLRRDACLRALRFSVAAIRADRDAVAQRLAGPTVALLREEGRLAELYELLELLRERAWDERCKADLIAWQCEKDWIEDSWGRRRSAGLRLGIESDPVQIAFEFGA